MSAKRALDLTLCLLALPIVLPIMVVIASVIRVESRGPVLFRQKRVGLAGRVFDIIKFRTMIVDAPARGPLITAADDPRITRAGRVLRKLKLDELPQIWNVLKGEMSLVGPRPEVEKYVRCYPADVRERVLSVRPGITDYAAIEFRDENELLQGAADREQMYIEVILPRKLQLYEKYIANQSVWTDLALIARTISKIFGSSVRESARSGG